MSTNLESSHAPSVPETWGGAFLLVIPGSAVIGSGIGMITGQLIPSSVIGFGAGCVLWGLIVALRKS